MSPRNAGSGDEGSERRAAMDGRTGWRRRDLLCRSLLVGGALGVGTGTLSGSAAASDVDYASREGFERLAQGYPKYQGITNDSDNDLGISGVLAWTRSYVMQAYLLMYRAHGDTSFLDAFVTVADDVLQQRDSVRGVADYRGESLPAWRADHPYTIGKATLTDRQGRPTLEVRSAQSYANDADVEVASGTEPGTFSLTLSNPVFDFTTTYDGLTMDPASPDYVETRVNEEGFPDDLLVTVADVRESPDDAGTPSPGTFGLDSPRYVFAVHTGQITAPLALFARIVHETPELRENSRYEDRAGAYLEAAKAAVRVHDDEWRETDEGEGYYVYRPGSPTGFESADVPTNQFLALARTIVQIAAITGEAEFVEKARRLVRTFKNDLDVDDGGAYVWTYWWSRGAVAEGWTTDDPVSTYRPSFPGTDTPEDFSHGHIDVRAATAAFRNEEVFGGCDCRFDGRDVARLARTFTRNLATEVDGSPTVNWRVDGSGPTGIIEDVSATWNVLAQWDEDVFAHTRSIWDAKGDQYGGASSLFAVANLNYWNRRRSSRIE